VRSLWRLATEFFLARQGRLVATLLLALATLLLVYAEQTPLAALRHALFDRYQQDLPRQRDALPAIVVEIDEASLTRHGQWPWDRRLMAQLVDAVGAGQPLAIGLDILFPEADRYSPDLLAHQLPSLAAPQRAALPDPDRALAASLARHPSVLAVSGIAAGHQGPHAPLRGTPLVSQGEDAGNFLTAYPTALGSLPLLERGATSLGLINATPDRHHDTDQGVLRRLPLIARLGDSMVPNLGLEMVRLALAAPAIAAQAGPRGLTAVGVGDYRLPVQADGSLLLHFGPFRADRYVSATAVLQGKIPAALFKDRFVLIGLTGLGLVDQVVTPLGEKVPGVDIHAQVIESLLAGEALRRPPGMAPLELAVLLAGGILLIAAVPSLRPSYALGLGAALGAGLIGAGYGAFAGGRWLFDGATLFVLLNPIFITLLGNTLVAADRHRRQAEAQLQANREAAAHLAGELDAARRIQLGLLPSPEQVRGDDHRCDLAALLEPAREVGGDFYDCFKLDPDRLCIAVGDVSGKGLPASLFMAVAKTLTGALTRRSDAGLGQALSEVESEISRENREMLFVTAFIACLDLRSGKLECACAGHEPPFLLRGEKVCRLPIGDIGGPPLGVLGDFQFTSATLQLEPGDTLCLFTDGLTEAYNGQEFFGAPRLEAWLGTAAGGGLPGLATADQLTRAIHASVRAFEGERPPHDDFTLLTLRWLGP